jgi:ferric-dicitrate binding protein FerR (iron transport regulator)
MSEKPNMVAQLSTQDLAELRALGALARTGLEGGRDDAWLARTDLATVAERRAARRRANARTFALAGALGASAAVALLVMRPARGPAVAHGPERAAEAAAPLAYTVETSSARYLFEDGTTVAPAADAAVSVDASAAKHPRVRVVGGRVHVRVVHKDGRQWTFHAGPYDVRVTGTAFDLTWDAAAGHMALHMREGAVEVRGPGLATPAPVRAGQDLSASPSGGAPEITAAAPAESAPIGDHAGHAHQHDSGGARGESWRVLVARGEFRTVLAQARERPLAACLARCSSEELRALGDAARYSRQPALATRALQTLRRRFPATADGTTATFLLGRTAEAQRRWKDAAGWYARYLEEAPTGELAVGAAAGRARATEELDGDATRPPAARVRSAR